MNQSNSQRVVRLMFSPEQIAEQKQFISELENNNAGVVSEGTFTEGIQFLKDTGDFVDTFNHA